MSHVIYKYAVSPSGAAFTIDLPIGAKPLTVQLQEDAEDASGLGGKMWVLQEKGKPTEHRTFKIYGTGHEIDIDRDKLNYVGTYQQFGGELVWHLFEVV